MYILSTLKDTIKIEPSDFSKDREAALSAQINRKYANRVLPNVGLCVAVFEIEQCSEGIILQGDGSIYHKVIFRMVVFKPSLDEVVLGKVARSSVEGIKVSFGFFDDCFIPSYRLPPHCAFDPARSEFYWVPPTSETDDGSSLSSIPEDERFYIITGETVRLRVVSEVFSDVTPKVAPKALGAAAAGAGGNAGAHAGQGQGGNHQGASGQGGAATGGIGQGHAGGTVELHTAGPAPYRIEASIQEAGLGLLDWWKGEEEQVEELVEAVENNNDQ